MWAIFGKEILVPALIGILAIAGLESWVRSDAAVDYIDIHRPGSIGTPTRVVVEKQLWHLEALARSDVDRVAVVGSSSVVNGIDERALRRQLRDQGYPLQPQTLGVTAFLAYELPLLKRLILTPRTRRVVYLYNLYSFADQVHPEAVDSRWDLPEMLRLRPLQPWDTAGDSLMLDRTAINFLWLTRYRDLLKDEAWRLLTGSLAPLDQPYDYPPGDVVAATQRPQAMEPALAPNTGVAWLRAAYLASTLRDDTMGYRGLERFCALAHQAGAAFTVAPVVEPAFNRFSAYARGADRAAVDRNVEAIARRCGAAFVPRERFKDIEAQDLLFRDFVHLYDTGRDIYTPRLGEMIMGR
jgi:hypothetical protein